MYTQKEKQHQKNVSHACVHKNLGLDFRFRGTESYQIAFRQKQKSCLETLPDKADNASMTTSKNTNLKNMSNDQLLLQTKNLVQKERQINIQVLQHLQEIEKRKLYLKRGFSSLFEYAVKELGYSESSAYRRIKAMKLCKELPETKTQISTGKLNLCTASKLQTVFEKQEKQLKNNAIKQQAIVTKSLLDKDKKEPSNQNLTKNDASIIHSEELLRHEVPISKAQKRDLINKVQGKSGKETEKLLSNTFPLICSERERVRDVNNDKVEIKVILNKESQQKLESLKKLLSHKNPNMSYGELFSLLAEMGLDKYDPKRKINKTPLQISSRSSKNRTRKGSMTTGTERNISTKVTKPKKEVNKKPQKASEKITKQKINSNQKYLKPSRYIPSVVRHHVWMRDQGQCTYICPKTNRRCSSNHLLQIDHIKPFSLGGTHEADNLRLLCANHNQFTFSRYQRQN